jgi:hypothetical protein
MFTGKRDIASEHLCLGKGYMISIGVNVLFGQTVVNQVNIIASCILKVG